jgi:hypothetical protein
MSGNNYDDTSSGYGTYTTEDSNIDNNGCYGRSDDDDRRVSLNNNGSGDSTDPPAAPGTGYQGARVRITLDGEELEQYSRYHDDEDENNDECSSRAAPASKAPPSRPPPPKPAPPVQDKDGNWETFDASSVKKAPPPKRPPPPDRTGSKQSSIEQGQGHGYVLLYAFNLRLRDKSMSSFVG